MRSGYVTILDRNPSLPGCRDLWPDYLHIPLSGELSKETFFLQFDRVVKCPYYDGTDQRLSNWDAFIDIVGAPNWVQEPGLLIDFTDVQSIPKTLWLKLVDIMIFVETSLFSVRYARPELSDPKPVVLYGFPAYRSCTASNPS